jgi:cytochrome c-type protein NapB
MMNGHRGSSGVYLVALLLACALTAVAAGLVAVERIFGNRGPPETTRLLSSVGARRPERSAGTGGLTTSPGPPLVDAEVFRLPTASMGIEADARRERQAHPRELATFHYLRAYPGAPPRIPHGLTPDEFRTGTCNTCHERGGYSSRFAAYVPVTPHPEMGFCLQCHVGNDAVTGIQHPSSDPDARCRQCHTPSGPPRTDLNARLDWPAPKWPPLPRLVTGRDPPPIPHDLQTRGNCLACHAGPAAVAEIRTRHPEWRACRQCHVASDRDSSTFTRGAAGPGEGTGGVR